MKSNKFIAALFFISALFSSGCDEIEGIAKSLGLTEDEIVEGLKSALNVGTDTSVAVLSVTDGYFKDELVKILLPDDAKKMAENISKVPGGQELMNEAILRINRAAEDAADKAKPIFINAIKGITIENGLAILNGENDAATQFLRAQTEDSLYTAFKPEIDKALNKNIIGNTSAESGYSDLVNAYNKASLNGVLWDRVEEGSLSEHTTNRALNGLFLKVAEEEFKIRTDVNHRVNDILKKVFDQQ